MHTNYVSDTDLRGWGVQVKARTSQRRSSENKSWQADMNNKWWTHWTYHHHHLECRWVWGRDEWMWGGRGGKQRWVGLRVSGHKQGWVQMCMGGHKWGQACPDRDSHGWGQAQTRMDVKKGRHGESGGCCSSSGHSSCYGSIEYLYVWYSNRSIN